MFKLELDLASIAALAEEREEENLAFRAFLKERSGSEVDAVVKRLNTSISAEINCTACGNCCSSLMVSITPKEKFLFASHFNLPQQEAEEKYLSTSMDGNAIMCNMPCVFLYEKKCTVYEKRFADCRDFPHLDKDGFTERLYSVLRNYGMCPIVFNVVEALKGELSFKDGVHCV